MEGFNPPTKETTKMNINYDKITKLLSNDKDNMYNIITSQSKAKDFILSNKQHDILPLLRSMNKDQLYSIIIHYDNFKLDLEKLTLDTETIS